MGQRDDGMAQLPIWNIVDILSMGLWKEEKLKAIRRKAAQLFLAKPS